MAKIHGIQKVAREMKEIPSGFHLEIWANKIRDDEYEVWTSALLTVGSWTTHRSHPEYVKLDRLISKYSENAWWTYDRRPSITECIRETIKDAFLEAE